MSNYFEQFLDDSFDDGYHHGRRGSVGDPHGQELICTKKIYLTFSYWDLRVFISSPWWPAWSQASTRNKHVTLSVNSILKIWYCKCDHVTPSYLTPALVPKLPTHPEPWSHCSMPVRCSKIGWLLTRQNSPPRCVQNGGTFFRDNRHRTAKRNQRTCQIDAVTWVNTGSGNFLKIDFVATIFVTEC